jgi:hypothetical protein
MGKEVESVNALYFSDEFEPALQIILGKVGLKLKRVTDLDHTVDDDSQHVLGWVVDLVVPVDPEDVEAARAQSDETIEAEVVEDADAD